MLNYKILVQARMTSNRFPGKMLVNLDGRPLIDHVLSRVQDSCPSGQVVLLTSEDPTDDPLVEYVSNMFDITIFRGELNNVYNRYVAYLDSNWCDWFVRVSGDSPLLDPGLIRKMVLMVNEKYDLVTNILNRTFPAGQSIEVVKSRPFVELPTKMLSEEDQEHVTKYFYRNPDSFKILSVVTDDLSIREARFVVDTPEDLLSIEDTLVRQPNVGKGYAELARLENDCND